MSAYSATTFPVSDAGSKWLLDNFITTGRINNVTDIIVAAEDPTSVRIVTSTGSGKLVIGDPTTVNQVVQAYKLWSGQVGASNPTDPISASVNNLITGAAPSTGSTAVNTATADASKVVSNISTKTGLPSWLVGIGLIVVLFFVIRWIWRKVKRMRRR